MIRGRWGVTARLLLVSQHHAIVDVLEVPKGVLQDEVAERRLTWPRSSAVLDCGGALVVDALTATEAEDGDLGRVIVPHMPQRRSPGTGLLGATGRWMPLFVAFPASPVAGVQLRLRAGRHGVLAATVRALSTLANASGASSCRPRLLARWLTGWPALLITCSSSSPSASSGHTVDGGEELLDAGDVAEGLHLALVEVVVVLVVVLVVGHGVDGELTPRHEDLAGLGADDVAELVERLALLGDEPGEMLPELRGEDGQQVRLLLLVGEGGAPASS